MLTIILGILGLVLAGLVIGLFVAWRFSHMVAGKAAAALPPKGRFT